MNASYADLATILARGISHCRMYFAGHPNVEAAARDFTRLLRSLAGKADDGVFRLGVAEGKLIHEGRFLVGPSIVGSRLTGFADLLEAGGFAFDSRIEPDEVVRFFGLAAATGEPVGGLPAARALLTAHGIGKVTLLPRYRDDAVVEDEDAEGASGLAELIPVYRAMFDAVERAHHHALRDRALDMDEARTAGEALVRAAAGSPTDIMGLVQYPDYDSYTVGHSVRVALLSVLAGREAGLSEHALGELAAAALLHDVGKGKIPQEILFKPGRLDEQERRVIETHPALGAAMLMETRGAGPLAVAAAWGHHRRWDGGGYPKMPYGGHTSEMTQLVHVCDVFEALTAVRPYKRALTPRDAFEIILKDRGAYSPLAITALRRAVGLFPPGSRVVLASGHRAVVTAAGTNIDRPRVRITHDEWGVEIPADRQPEVDLQERGDAPPIRHLVLGT